jgi:hypothetical protein
MNDHRDSGKVWRRALGLALFAVSIASVGCVMSGGEGEPAPAEAQSAVITITAGSLERLQPGTRLVVDLGDESKPVTFDVSEGPIDYSRVEVASQDAPRVGMNEWLAAQREANPELDVEAIKQSGFSLAGGAAGSGRVRPTHDRLFCRGEVVCVNHVLWCQPQFPGGNPTPIGAC